MVIWKKSLYGHKDSTVQDRTSYILVLYIHAFIVYQSVDFNIKFLSCMVQTKWPWIWIFSYSHLKKKLNGRGNTAIQDKTWGLYILYIHVFMVYQSVEPICNAVPCTVQSIIIITYVYNKLNYSVALLGRRGSLLVKPNISPDCVRLRITFQEGRPMICLKI